MNESTETKPLKWYHKILTFFCRTYAFTFKSNDEYMIIHFKVLWGKYFILKLNRGHIKPPDATSNDNLKQYVKE